MVKIYMYGADEFLGHDISSMMSGRLAKIYQIKEEEILFYEDNEVYSRIDEEYPLFVTEKNSVVVEAADEDDEENIDIFSEIK